jgi:hypothetical protein
VIAQLLGGVAAIAVLRTLYPNVTPEDAAQVVLPHNELHARSDPPDDPRPLASRR